jgi:rubrerythrin
METFENMDGILDFAIANEQEAVDFYNNLASQANNDEMKQIFAQFAQEEMGHKSRLLKIKETGANDLKIEKVKDLKIADYSVAAKPTPGMSYQDALILAMRKEKAAFKLYMTLSEKAENAVIKELFFGLAVEESKHKLRFELEYDENVLKEN